jgi:hypothetical protein
MVCTVLWALGTYAGEANVCGFQASVTNDGISFYPFYAPPNTGTPVIDPDTVKPPDVIPDLIDGGDSPSGGDDGGGGTIISKLVKATAIVITTTAVNEAIDLVLQPEPAPQPDEEPLPDPPDQDECVLEDAPGTTLGGNDCDDPLLVEIWRGVGGNKKKDYWKNPSLKPRDFRPRPGVDDDGLSLFELANLPPNPVTPYAYPFTVLILGEKISGVTGLLSEVPACTATFTPEHGPGHWSVNCSGSIDQLLSGYAEDNRDRTILYPSFIGDFAEDRQFDWPN